jgi:hypothetical protein
LEKLAVEDGRISMPEKSLETHIANAFIGFIATVASTAVVSTHVSSPPISPATATTPAGAEGFSLDRAALQENPNLREPS